jgi:hypothetical protein
MSYPHTLTIAVPEALKYQANQFALILGEGNLDHHTFELFDHVATDGTIVCVQQTRVRQTFIDTGLSPDPLVTPPFAPGADTAAAEVARASLQFDAAAAAGIIAVHLYTPFSEALGLLNVTRSEDV